MAQMEAGLCCLSEMHSGIWTQDPAEPIVPALVVVIPARNEEAVVGEMLDWLGAGLGPSDRIHVIADRCSDDTARIACKHGAIVHVRGETGTASDAPAGRVEVHGRSAGKELQGKGAALRWWLEQTHSQGCPQDPVLILDADSRPAPDLLPFLRRGVREGQDVIQVRIAPMLSSTSPVALLAALSEVVEHRVKDSFRARMGWPVRLRGTGMVIRRGLLEELAPKLGTFVEDMELTLLVADRGIKIHYLDQSYLADPKPENEAGTCAQRARWFRGQIDVLCLHWKTVLRLLLRGPGSWSLLGSIFLKPATLFLMLKLGVFLAFSACWLLLGGSWMAAGAGLILLDLILESGLYLYGLRFVPDWRLMLWAAARMPVYLLMWCRSLRLSMFGNPVWHRARADRAASPGGIQDVDGPGGLVPSQEIVADLLLNR